jgi:polyisoprenoid-binding protein YceI
VLASALILLLAAPSPSPTARTFAVDASASTLRYRVVHRLHTVEAASLQAEGKVVLQPGGRLLVMVRAEVASFASGDANRDAHMQEVLDVARFPHVIFKGIADAAGLSGGTATADPLPIDGELELHGVKQRLRVPVRVELRPDGTAHVRASLDVSLDAHRVERPALLFVKVDDLFRVEVDLLLRQVEP